MTPQTKRTLRRLAITAVCLPTMTGRSRRAIFPGRLNRWLAAAAAAVCVAGCRAAGPDSPGAPAGAGEDAAAPPGADSVVVQVSHTDTLLSVSNEDWWRPFPLDDYIERLDDPESKVLDRRWGGDGRLYVLVRSVEASRPEPIGAFCASGQEMHIIWLAADSTMQVVDEAMVRVASCLLGYQVEDESLEGTHAPWHVRFRMPGDTLATVEYDPRTPARGLRMTTVLDTLHM